jgi:serine/threonine protein kinase
MEHVEFSLLDGLRKHPKGLSLLRTQLITFQLLQACAFMHANLVMHRDLKPSNILLHKDGTVKVREKRLAFLISLSPSLPPMPSAHAFCLCSSATLVWPGRPSTVLLRPSPLPW